MISRRLEKEYRRLVIETRGETALGVRTGSRTQDLHLNPGRISSWATAGLEVAVLTTGDGQSAM